MRGNQLPVFLQIGWGNEGESAASFHLFYIKVGEMRGNQLPVSVFFTKRLAK
jgi:hypothetical protein